MLTDSLSAVTVTADKGMVISRADTVQITACSTVSDVLMHSPGLYVMDNGGYAGLKTVALRGMGSAHTSVYVDGVRVGNVQSGQSDLGMLGIENFNSVVVDYAQNSVNFSTARPVFGESPVSGRVRFAAGSFGSYQPSARLDFRLSDNLALSADVAGNWNKGDFTYSDSLIRTNNDMNQIKAGLNLWGIMNRGDYHIKAYWNKSERGAPGSISYPSDDRQADMNAFIQGFVRKRFSDLYALQLSAKSSYDDIFYMSSWGDIRYGQTEFQLNSSHDFRITNWWRLTLAADAQWDDLKSDNYNASRFSVFSVLSSQFSTERFSSKLSVEYNGVFDTGQKNRNFLSPSVDLRLEILEGLDITAFARRAHRVPVFNELYYVGYGNPDLKLESVWMADLGLDFSRRMAEFWTLKAKADFYYNALTDKITSAPSPGDPNIWLPYNIGKVSMKGSDMVVGIRYDSSWKLALDVKYSYLSALDKTPGSSSYGQSIPYVAEHSVAVSADAAYKGWGFQPVWHLRAGRHDYSGAIPDWNTLDMLISRSLSMKKAGNINLFLSLKNILDCRYEIVAGYPMPGFSITGGIEYNF